MSKVSWAMKDFKDWTTEDRKGLTAHLKTMNTDYKIKKEGIIVNSCSHCGSNGVLYNDDIMVYCSDMGCDSYVRSFCVNYWNSQKIILKKIWWHTVIWPYYSDAILFDCIGEDNYNSLIK